MFPESAKTLIDCLHKSVTPEGVDMPKLGIIKRNPTYVTLFGVTCEEGEMLINNNQACHAGLNAYSYSAPPSKIEYLASRIQWGNNLKNKDLKPQIAPDFIQWLVHESPYAKTFVGDAADVIEHGAFVCTSDVNRNLLAGAMMAHRMLTEHYATIARSWWELKERGVNPRVAFVAAHEMTLHDDEVSANGHGWHAPLTSDVFINYVKNFVNGEHSNHETYKEKPGYNSVSGIWTVGMRGASARFSDMVHKAIAGSVKVEKAAKNPFKKEVEKRIGGSKADEFFNLYAESLLQFERKTFDV